MAEIFENDESVKLFQPNGIFYCTGCGRLFENADVKCDIFHDDPCDQAHCNLAPLETR